ncbi:hypothetical protein DERF_006636 [Dermatophagoides farinae]|uniref:EamA domain-containing protein n=1 Tax=Dermatophagoides farinae TaxID=6954 RepID=A0A922L761_DERFA|nr:hypothetical protein DERF_006636 [Dermatophagoides farinae]
MSDDSLTKKHVTDITTIATIQNHHLNNHNHHHNVHSITVEDDKKLVSKFKKPPIFGSAFGITCAMVSVLCFSFCSVIAKLLNSSYQIPGIQVLVLRSFIQIALCSIILFYQRSLPGYTDMRTNLYIFGCSIIGTIAVCCLFTAFNKIPIGDATTIYLTSPVFVAIFSFIFLHEPFRWLQSITIFITIIGVGFIAKPVFIFGTQQQQQTDQHYAQEILGQILSFISAISSSLALIFLRKLKSTSPIIILLWFAIAITIIGSIILVHLRLYRSLDWHDSWCIVLLVLIGLLSMVEQYFITLSLQYEDASTISVTRSFNIVLAFLWEVIIFQETITWTSIVGAILVSCCIIAIALNKRSYQQQTKN